MINREIEKYILKQRETFLIDAENVANVHVNNPLSHAFLVLTKVKYSKIPVLDKGDRFVGLLSLSNVCEKRVDLIDEDVIWNVEQTLTVADAMEVGVPFVREDWELEEVLNIMVDYSFVPVLNKDDCLVGILTRKQLLKSVNALVHGFDKDYLVLKKNEKSGAKLILQGE